MEHLQKDLLIHNNNTREQIMILPYIDSFENQKLVPKPFSPNQYLPIELYKNVLYNCYSYPPYYPAK
ncbi:hypothetical protein D3C85_1910350 [compost metagenome]